MRIHDIVELTVDVPRHGLRRGLRGTVVEIWTEPQLAYEVEFPDADLPAPGTIALRPEQLTVVPQPAGE